MYITLTKSLEEFIESNSSKYDAIVVEGYDGVGKGLVLNKLSEILGVIPYRPDYNLWQKYDHRKIDRWKVSGFFWDVFSHFSDYINISKPLLFDRGVISGAVYNGDDNILRDYKGLLGNMNVLHILVTCSREDYFRFAEIRRSDILPDYSICSEATELYKKAFAISGVDFIIYENHYDESISEKLSKTCRGCGHYSYGVCRHPHINCKVNPDSERCELSRDTEVQDMEVINGGTEMQCV